jgi:NTE family protein
MKYDAVIEGSGVRGCAVVGAMEFIERQGFTPSHLAGTSSGAMLAALRVAGYTPKELRHMLFSTDFTKFCDGDGFGRKLYNILMHRGIYDGDIMQEFLADKLAAKGIYKFGDLLSDDTSDIKYKWRFRCIVADVTKEKMVVFPDDANLYGIDPNELDVALAVRCSMSIPVFFKPKNINNSVMVDGGILSNYPINMWDSVGLPEWPTFGILLDDNGDEVVRGHIGRWPHDYFLALFETMMKAHDKRLIKPGDFKHRTIKVPVSGIKTTDFDLTWGQKLQLYYNGYTAAKNFLGGWSWEDYLEWCKER